MFLGKNGEKDVFHIFSMKRDAVGISSSRLFKMFLSAFGFPAISNCKVDLKMFSFLRLTVLL